MNSGTVKWYNNHRGSGIIINDADGQELFVHFSGINVYGFKELEEGQRVTFDIQKDEGARMPKAVNVRPK